MSWDARQHALLSAMGYCVLRHADAAPPVASAVVADGGVPARVDDGGAPATASNDPLLRALRRAAGGRDLSSLALPPLDRLRGDAAAKRALWPQLRKLRRH